MRTTGKFNPRGEVKVSNRWIGYTPVSMACALGVSAGTVYNWLYMQRMASQKSGKFVYCTADQVTAMICGLEEALPIGRPALEECERILNIAAALVESGEFDAYQAYVQQRLRKDY